MSTMPTPVHIGRDIPAHDNFSLAQLSGPTTLTHGLKTVVRCMQRFAQQETDGQWTEANASKELAKLTGVSLPIAGMNCKVQMPLGFGVEGVVVQVSSPKGPLAVKLFAPFPTVQEQERLPKRGVTASSFYQEAQALARLSKAGVEGVPAFHGAAAIRVPSDGLTIGVVVMDLVPGERFSDFAYNLPKTKTGQIEFLSILARVFEIAHSVIEARVLPDDVVEKNIIVERGGHDPKVCLVDFGSNRTVDNLEDARELGRLELGATWEQLLNARLQLARIHNEQAVQAFIDAVADPILELQSEEITLLQAAARLRVLGDNLR